MTAEVLIKFMRGLVASSPGKVFLILDNLRGHRAKWAKRWRETGIAKRDLEVFSCAPELDPYEVIHDDLEGMVHGGSAIRRVKEPQQRTRFCMRKLQRIQERVTSYFQSGLSLMRHGRCILLPG